jgi:preprotein translocase subunit SecY
MTIEPSSLTREKTLFSLYALSFKFPGSWFNRVLTLAALLLAGLWSWHLRASPERLFAQFRRVVELDFAFATSILGFLVAGFTVFVTITKVDIFVEMAGREYEATGESYLKYNLNAFMLAFVHYVAFVFVCLSVQLFGQSGGPAAYLLEVATSISPQFTPVARGSVAGALFTLMCAWSVYVVLLLKSFIYNTYQVLTTVVRWEMERPPN